MNKTNKFSEPIFIIGEAHSGTTILYRLLGYHPQIAYFSQYSQRGGNIKGRFSFPFYYLFNRWGRGLFDYDWKKGKSIRNIIVPAPMEPHKIWDYCLPKDKEYYKGKELNRRVLAVLNKEAEDWDKERIIVKLPRLSKEVLILHKIIPDAYFVHIIRDGRAVSLSNQHKFNSLEESVSHWEEIVRYLKEAETEIGSEKFITIRYEDFCGDVRGNIKKILRVCQLSADENFLDKIPNKLTITNSKWLSKVNNTDRLFLKNKLKELLNEYGYM